MTQKNRLEFIDCLRAIAILLVFVRHASEVFVGYGHGSRLVYETARRLNMGELGVVIFFAISGFLIPSSFSGDRIEGTIRYVASRVFRLFPAFLVSVVPSAATHYWLGGARFSWHEIAVNCTMVPRLFGVRLANGAYWTLEVEAAFYLLCLILFWGGVIGESFVFAAILLCCALVFETSQHVFFGGLLNPPLLGTTFVFFINIGVMCWGTVARAWWGRNRLYLITALIFWGFAASWILYRPVAEAASLFDHRGGVYDTNFLAAYGIGLAVFLLVVARGAFASAWLGWVGRISYSLYLFHGSVIHGLQHLLEHYPALQGYPADAYSAVALVLALAVAHVSFHLIERPGIRIGRRVADRLVALLAKPGGWLRRDDVGRGGFLYERPGAGEMRKSEAL